MTFTGQPVRGIYSIEKFIHIVPIQSKFHIEGLYKK